MAAILINDDYKGIGVLYSSVLTDEHQVFVMSISKFLKHNFVIVEKSYEFLNANFLDRKMWKDMKRNPKSRGLEPG